MSARVFTRVALPVLASLLVAACAFEDEGERWRPASTQAGKPPPTPTTEPAPQPPQTPTPQAPAAGPVDPFSLTPTDVAPKSPLTASQWHAAKGVNPQTPARQSCADTQCHNSRSAPMLFGVTVCADAKCSKVAEGVEIRVATGDGKVYQAFTGADGNAWFPGQGSLASPARVAVRGKTTTKAMHDPLEDGRTAGSCNMQGCHGADPGGTTPPKNVILFAP